MLDPGIIRQGLINEAIQFAIVIVLVYHSFAKSRIDRQKRLFFFAFASYGLSLILHMYIRAAQAGFFSCYHHETLALFSHTFKTMFFMLFGYAILDALVIEETLKRIMKSSAITAFLILFMISVGIILVEGRALLFNDTAKELIYELAEMAVQVMIINIVYQSWRDTKSRNLLMIGGAFVLFFAADAAHIYHILWGGLDIEYTVRHVLRVFALALLAYALIFYRAEP